MRRTLFAAGLLLLSSLGAFAEDAAPVVPPVPVTEAEVTAADLATWLNDLQSDDFKARQQATESLEKAGLQAVEALQSIAEGNNFEASIRSLTVLERISRSEDKEAAKGAKAALESLTSSAQPVVAQRARMALANGKLPNALPAGRLGMQVRAGRQMQVRIVNGKREITIKEADREVRFTDENGKNITAEVTKTVNGKKQVEKIEAKDIDDLKKKNPDLAKLFEQNGNAIQVNVAFGGIQVQGRPVLQAIVPNGKAAHKDIEQALSKLKELEGRIEKLTPETTADELKQLQQDIASVRKELHAAQAKLE